MRRSLLLPSLVILAGLVGCRAQEDRKNLQNSVTRLEQRLQNMDDYLKSLQQEKAKQKEEQSKAIHEREEEMRRLQSVLAEQERRHHEQAQKREQERAEAERAMARAKEEMGRAREDMAREMDRMKKQLDEERTKMRAAVDADRKNREAEAEKARASERRSVEAAKADMEKAVRERTNRLVDLERVAHDMENQRNEARKKAEAAQQEATKLHQALANAKATPPVAKVDERAALLDKLVAERRELGKLREQVMADLKAAHAHAAHSAHAAAADDDDDDDDAVAEALRAENAQLKNRVRRLENALADAKQAPPAAAPMRIAQMVPGTAPQKPPAPPAGAGTIVINNEEGEVHIHIHGGAPSITTSGKPPAGMPMHDLQLLPPKKAKQDDEPKAATGAIEVAPLRLRLNAGPEEPAKAEKTEKAKPAKKGEGKKINDEDSAEIEAFLMALFGVS